MSVAIAEIYESVRATIDSTVRPANTDTYDAGDMVANAVAAENVVPLIFSAAGFGTGHGVVRRALLYRDSTTQTNASFRLHLFSSEPVIGAGDNEAFAIGSGRNHLTSIDFNMTAAGAPFPGTADRIKVGTLSSEVNFDLYNNGPNERRIYGLLQVLAAYTPGESEFFEVTLELAAAK